MQVARLLILLAFAISFAMSGPASGEVRVALVVANAAYKDAPLENPTRDADLVQPALERMGFDVTTVKDADLATFAVALEAFYKKAKGADLALFYFAGHGFAVGGQNYLMSVSADVTSNLDVIIRSGGIELDEIIASISDAAKVSLVFIDACRNDPRVTRGGKTGRGLARMSTDVARSMFVGLSTRAGDLAEDGEPGKGSPFARAFAEYMPGPGLRLDDAFRQVRRAVIEETHGDQRPEARDDLDQGLVVVSAEEAVDGNITADSSTPPLPPKPEEETKTADLTSPALVETPPPQPQHSGNPQKPTPEIKRAIYYFQGREGENGEAVDGTAEWSEINKNGRPAIHAEIRIPSRGATLTLTISQNSDGTIPASHLIELQVAGSLEDSPIENVPALVLKQTEQARGMPLDGASVRVTPDFFWIALSSDLSQIRRNLQLLNDNSWIDIPILFSDQTRALVTLEGGGKGDEAFLSVLKKWSGGSNPALEGGNSAFQSEYKALPDGTIVKIR